LLWRRQLNDLIARPVLKLLTDITICDTLALSSSIFPSYFIAKTLFWQVLKVLSSSLISVSFSSLISLSKKYSVVKESILGCHSFSIPRIYSCSFFI
jgi:L-fucose mutarotase/ribose pyranase (RbsD/FucU family)